MTAALPVPDSKARPRHVELIASPAQSAADWRKIRRVEHNKIEIAIVAAGLVVDDGMDFEAAKRQAVRQLGLPPKTALPSHDELEAAVREHIALYCPDSQPRELAALRDVAQAWMRRMQPFRPYLSGSVWRGTATLHSDIYLQLFCDDPKSAEIELINQGLAFEARMVQGFLGKPVPTLSLQAPCTALDQTVGVHLMVHDYDDLRGALRPDANGRSPRGDLKALNDLMIQDPSHV